MGSTYIPSLSYSRLGSSDGSQHWGTFHLILSLTETYREVTRVPLRLERPLCTSARVFTQPDQFLL